LEKPSETRQPGESEPEKNDPGKRSSGSFATESRETSREIELLCRGEYGDPFRVLGPHWIPDAAPLSAAKLIIRAFQPAAERISILWSGSTSPIPAARIHPAGLFAASLPQSSVAAGGSTPVAPDQYHFRIEFPGGHRAEIFDPYAFTPVLTDFDLYLMGEGAHYLNYEKLGAHLREIAGIWGVHFAVWAPNARRVSVVGDFNSWDGRVHSMRHLGASGVWEIFIPGLAEGAPYKFELLPQSGPPALKADPYAFASELRPNTASIVRDIEKHPWDDAAWMARRLCTDWLSAPISIYEVHPGSWRRVESEGHRWLTYRELAAKLIPYVKDMGFTHIEFMPIMEYPYDPSWGYQTVGYFAATSRYGSPDDFMYFVDQCHQAGIGVLLDWTPAHFPRDAHGLANFDGTHLYEHADPRRGSHPDWGTLVFNYGRNEVQNFLISNALFWLDKYHLDGLRVDAVASMLYLDYSRKAGEWLPNEQGGRENLQAVAFLRHLNEAVHSRHPGVMMIAEESTAWPAVTKPTYSGGLGFDLKWNMGWMNDTLRYMARESVHRTFHHNEMTFSMIYAFSENFVLPLSHDEVVHGKRSLLSKMPGDSWRQFANLRILLAWQYLHPGKKLLFMGSELASRHEWSETRGLEWRLLESPLHAAIQRLVKDLNRLYSAEPALHQVEFSWEGFEWLSSDDSRNSVLAFQRRARDAADFLAVVVNFTPVVREGYRIGVPEPGRYVEILNTDATHYGGSDSRNPAGIESQPVPSHGRPDSLLLRLPPLAAIVLRRTSSAASGPAASGPAASGPAASPGEPLPEPPVAKPSR
jgi:1,4-alpha-glucan branching enzyme